MPEFLYDDFQKSDLAFYSFRSGLRRWRLWRSASIEGEATALADSIRDLSGYQTIVLVAHSLGGILAKAAIAHLHSTNQRKVLKRIAGLVMLATPQLGSIWAIFPLCYLSKDLSILRSHNKFINNLKRVFVNNIKTDETTNPASPSKVPMWAVVATEDFWVQADSAVDSVPDAQVRHVACSHTEVCKPTRPSDDVYVFVSDCLRKAFKSRRDELEWDSYSSFPAADADVPDLFDLARTHVSRELSSEAQIREIIALSPECTWTIRRIVADEPGPLVGYFVVLPLRAETAAKIKSEMITGADLTAEDLALENAAPSTIYVGAVAGTGMAAKAVALDKLKIFLSTVLGDASCEILTRPVTPDGLRTVRRNGFRPVNETRSEIGHLYRANYPDMLHFSSRGSAELESRRKKNPLKPR